MEYFIHGIVCSDDANGSEEEEKNDLMENENQSRSQTLRLQVRNRVSAMNGIDMLDNRQFVSRQFHQPKLPHNTNKH